MLALTALGMILAVAVLPGGAGTGRQAGEIVAAATVVLAAMLLVIARWRDGPRLPSMQLQALHHATMITGDAAANVDFHAAVLGLRMVKKTVNFDRPEAYHLYFGDEHGSPGSILTWFEFPGAARGRAGAGMIHRPELGVGGDAALEFWKDRVDGLGYPG